MAANDQKIAPKQNDLQIQELEKLLNQSILGYHHLFEKGQIANILKKPTEEIDFFTVENIDIIQKLFNDLIKKNTMQEKQAFIGCLDEKNFEILLRTYFHIVESTLLSSSHMKH